MNLKPACISEKTRSNKANKALDGVLEQLKTYTCVFCFGFGHNVKECTTKTTIDRTAKTINCKWLWGEYKASVLLKNRQYRSVLYRQEQQDLIKARRAALKAEMERAAEEVGDATP